MLPPILYKLITSANVLYIGALSMRCCVRFGILCKNLIFKHNNGNNNNALLLLCYSTFPWHCRQRLDCKGFLGKFSSLLYLFSHENKPVSLFSCKYIMYIILIEYIIIALAILVRAYVHHNTRML